MEKITYSIIVPVLNEQEVLKEFYKRLNTVMLSLKDSYEIIFVNDGSVDNSLDIMREFQKKNQRIRIIDFSRNFGHQIAITAGMDYTQGEAVVVIDSDLQDPPEVILEFIKKWKDGAEIVYGVRKKREGETLFKKLTAKLFYRVLGRITKIEIPLDAGDFRLLDRKIVDIFKKNIRERNRYIRGLTSWVGFKQVGVFYDREKRFAGKTKYPFSKMIKFGLDAIISFSIFPLRLIACLGIFVASSSFLYGIYALFLKFFSNKTIPGWTSLILAVTFLGGIQLISLGLVAEYLSRINDESKARPLYVVREVIGKQ
jgi:polyisoprenyl-phosphate glycosyltransferase